MALPVVQLAEGVADMDALDLGRLDTGVGQRRVDGVADQVGDRAAVLRKVAGEVRLVPAEDADAAGGGVRVCSHERSRRGVLLRRA